MWRPHFFPDIPCRCYFLCPQELQSVLLSSRSGSPMAALLCGKTQKNKTQMSACVPLFNSGSLPRISKEKMPLITLNAGGKPIIPRQWERICRGVKFLCAASGGNGYWLYITREIGKRNICASIETHLKFPNTHCVIC